MALKTTKTFRIIVFMALTILILYFINYTIAGVMTMNKNPRFSFAVTFLMGNAIGLLISSLTALFLFEKHHKFTSQFLGASPLKSIALVVVPIVLMTLFGSHNNPGVDPHLNGAMMGFLVIFLCIASEMGFRGYLTEELKRTNPYLRPLLVGSLWFLVLFVAFIPYVFSDFSHQSRLTFSKLLGIVIMGYVTVVIFSWFLDQAIGRTKSLFVSTGLAATFYFFLINGITGIGIAKFNMCTLFLIESMLGFVLIGTWKKGNAPKTKYAKPISKLTYLKTVRRRERSRTGKKRYVTKTFSLDYDPAVKDTRGRVMAKFVDWGFYLIVGFVLYGAIQRDFMDDYELFAVGFLLMLVMNPLSETFFGNTIGKYIFGLKVIGDYGHTPNLTTSYKRNFLSAISIVPLMRFFPGGGGPVINRHNRLSNTFVVKSNTIPEIIEKLEQAKADDDKAVGLTE